MRMEKSDEAGRIIVQEVVEWLEDPGASRGQDTGASRGCQICSRNVITLC